MFHKYAGSSYLNSKVVTFDQMKEQKNTMSLVELFTYLNDFKVLLNFPNVKRE